MLFYLYIGSKQDNDTIYISIIMTHNSIRHNNRFLNVALKSMNHVYQALFRNL